MSTVSSEMRFGGFHGTCFRCDGIGHHADDTVCPWLTKAASRAEHEARIDSLRDRYWEFRISASQKAQFIRFENKKWYDGKVPSQLT